MYSSSHVSLSSRLLGAALFFSLPFVVLPSASPVDISSSGDTESVSVTPDAEVTSERPANSDGHVLTFTVTNTGTESDTYEVRCVGAAKAECGGTTPTRVTLAAGSSATVDVSFRVLDPGSGLVSLLAVSETTESHDRGSYRVPVSP